MLFPDVMSFVNEVVAPYSEGFIQPTVDKPIRLRAALTRDTIPANAGAEAEVPDTA